MAIVLGGLAILGGKRFGVAGQDIHAHGGELKKTIVEVRDWLSSASRRKMLLGGQAIAERYTKFRAELPELCTKLGRREDELTFSDSRR